MTGRKRNATNKAAHALLARDLLECSGYSSERDKVLVTQWERDPIKRLIKETKDIL